MFGVSVSKGTIIQYIKILTFAFIDIITFVYWGKTKMTKGLNCIMV